MPLHDHFHPPWSERRPWEGFHSAWAAAIAFHLNSGLLPAEYYAMPLLQVSGRVEVDIGTFQEEQRGSANGGTATAVWAPPRPTLTLPLEIADTDAFEVQVMRNFGGPKLRAAIELVSPSNKDREVSRRAFAAKCAGYLRRNISVIVIDIVTKRGGNLHAELLRILEQKDEPFWESPSQLFTAAYRCLIENGAGRLEAWPRELAIGAPLPELPLWLEVDLSVPLRLEESYTVTCGSLRMGG